MNLMPSYETLDAIADIYIPILALISFGYAVAAGVFKGNWRITSIRLLGIGVVAFFSYGIMLLDQSLNIWPALNLDYSTHTAVSLGLTIFLMINFPKYLGIWASSFIVYLLLMLYQEYHTIADIGSTGLVIALPVSLLLIYLRKLIQSNITIN